MEILKDQALYNEQIATLFIRTKFYVNVELKHNRVIDILASESRNCS